MKVKILKFGFSKMRPSGHNWSSDPDPDPVEGLNVLVLREESLLVLVVLVLLLLVFDVLYGPREREERDRGVEMDK